MRHIFITCIPGFTSLFLLCCGGTKTQLEIPDDMPPVCRGVDFNLNVEMRDMCGVKVRKYRSYKNVAQYRLMTDPKGGRITQKGNKYELRLPDMLPTILPASFSGKIDFREELRSKYLKSSYEYHEFLSRKNNSRVKMMRLEILLNNGQRQSVCYTINGHSRKFSKVQGGFANQLEPLECDIFEKIRK